MTPKTSCTLIPNREFFIVVRRDSMMAKVYFLLSGFRFLLCLFLCFYGCRGLVVACLPEKSRVIINGTPPFVVHLLNAKGVGMGDSLTGVLYLFCIGSAAFVLLPFEILPLGLYFLVHFEFGIALGIFVTVLNEYRDKVGE